MSEDIPDDVKAQLHADSLIFGAGYAEVDDDGDYHRINPTKVTISVEDTDTKLRRATEPVEDHHFEGSFSVEFEAETVECPRCTLPNPIPPKGLLTLFSRGPLPCRLCGHPLL